MENNNKVKKISTPNSNKTANTKSNTSNSNTSNSNSRSVKNKVEILLPQTRVKMIMKSSPEIDNIGTDALYVITKATELFIDHISEKAYKVAGNDLTKGLQYKHLSDLVLLEDNLEFLRDIIPKKLPLRIALQQIAKQEEDKMKDMLI